jgi:hypothetical protein
MIFAFAPLLVLGLGSCLALGAALIALCLGEGRYAAIEAGLGVAMGYAALPALILAMLPLGPGAEGLP